MPMEKVIHSMLITLVINSFTGCDCVYLRPSVDNPDSEISLISGRNSKLNTGIVHSYPHIMNNMWIRLCIYNIVHIPVDNCLKKFLRL